MASAQTISHERKQVQSLRLPSKGRNLTYLLQDLAKGQRPSEFAWQAYTVWAGSDSVGRPLHAPPKRPAAILRVLRDAFARMKEGAEFKAEVKKVSGEDAEILLADEADLILRQLVVVSPSIQDFMNGLMKKYLNR
jgi:hypothetical protein